MISKFRKYSTSGVVAVVLVLALGAVVWGTVATRTTVRNATYGAADWLHKVQLVEYSWTIAAAASGDTVLLGPFDYRHIGYQDTKPITITMEPQRSGVAKDSIHWKADYLISTDLAPVGPATGAGTSKTAGNTTDWKLVESESVAFDSVAYRTGNVLTREWDTFNPRTYGNAAHVLIRVVGTGKTGAGTLVFKVALPADVQFKAAVR